MTAEERKHRLEAYLQQVEFASLEDLAKHVGSSVSTVRRDLTVMEVAGNLKRTHGGARIVTESQVRDRSARGVRLKLAANVSLPKRIRFFDDVGKRLYEGVVAWQRGRDIGISLRQEVDTRELTRAELFKLGIKLKN